MNLLKRPMFWVFVVVVLAAIVATALGACASVPQSAPPLVTHSPAPAPSASGFWVPVGGYDVECSESQSGRVICDWDNKRLRIEG